MRVLEFVRPPNPDDTVFQVEGELVKKLDQKNNWERPWICKSHAIGPLLMKALVEAYPVSTTAKDDTAPPGERKVSNHPIYRQFLATERIRLDVSATTTLTHLVMAIFKVDNHDNRFIGGSFDIIDARVPSLMYSAELPNQFEKPSDAAAYDRQCLDEYYGLPLAGSHRARTRANVLFPT
jgi:hypothetical protein